MARTYSKRTDPHRPGAIIPAHYEPVLSFSLASMEGGWPVPSWGVNCAAEGHYVPGEPGADGRPTKVRIPGTHGTGPCCVVHLRELGERFARDGGPGKCDVCGANYIYGDVWRYTPTSELIFVGHDCAAKYEMLTDRSEWQLAMGRLRAAAAVECEKALRAEERKALFAAHPGLEEALEMEHHILADLKARLHRERNLTDKQIALAQKLAHEIKNPAAAEVLVPAPTGKQTFQGTVVSMKSRESGYGDGFTMKMTVKVTTPTGVWLAWGTMPKCIFEDHGGKKGALVELTATLKPGRDAHFAITSRPSGKVVKRACESDCEQCLREQMGAEAFDRMVSVKYYRELEASARTNGSFDAAVRHQWIADEIERSGWHPADSGFSWRKTDREAIY